MLFVVKQITGRIERNRAMKAETMIEVFCKGFKQKCKEFRMKHGMLVMAQSHF